MSFSIQDSRVGAEGPSECEVALALAEAGIVHSGRAVP